MTPMPPLLPMVRRLVRRLVLPGLAAAALSAVMLSGCAGAPPRLYVLTPMAGEGGAKTGGTLSVGVQPVTMPGYLDRPAIVSFVGPHELSVNGDDQWAEGLPTNITRVLAENLSILLGSDRVYVLPSWLNDRYAYTVTVRIDRFEQAPSGEAVLDAEWTIQGGATDKVIARDRTRVARPVPGSGYPSLVAAMNDTLTALSRDIAAALETLARNGRNRAG